MSVIYKLIQKKTVSISIQKELFRYVFLNPEDTTKKIILKDAEINGSVSSSCRRSFN